jgi:hypothetical protein
MNDSAAVEREQQEIAQQHRRRSNVVLLRKSFHTHTTIPPQRTRGDSNASDTTTTADSEIDEEEEEEISTPVSTPTSKPTWINDLRSAWEEEIMHNMSVEKKMYFLQFGPETADDDDDEDGPKRNRRIRNHMRAFIETEQTKDSHNETHYFFARSNSNAADFSEDMLIVHENDETKSITSSSIPPTVEESLDELQLPQKLSFSSSNDSPRTAVKKSLLQRLFSTSVTNISTIPTSVNQWITELQKYEQRLVNFIKDSQTICRELQNKEQVERLFIYKELCSLKSRRLYPVIDAFRKYYILKILALQKRRLLEKDCKRVLKRRLLDTQNAIIVLQNENKVSRSVVIPEFLTSNGYYFLSVEAIMTQSPQFMARHRVIKRLELAQKNREREYIAIRKQHYAHKRSRPKRDQQNALKQLLEKYQTPNCDRYDRPVEWETFLLDIFGCDKLQFQFNCLVGDVRSDEGQSIKTFVTELKKIGFERIPPSEILEYAQSFVSYVAKLNQLKNDDLTMKRLSYLVHNFIFGDVIAKELTNLENTRHEQDNSLFCRQQKLVQNLTPTQLGVANKFLPLQIAMLTSEDMILKQTEIQSVDQPFENPIQILGLLSLCITPNDMLKSVHMCAKQIHHIAKRQCDLRGKEFTFGADEFFPVLVYVVAHATLPHIHTNLAFMSKYMSDDDRAEQREVIYYLTSLEGAVMYLQSIGEEDVANLTQEEVCSSSDTAEKVASSQSPN